MCEKLILDFFKKYKINYRLFEHQQVFTVDDKPIVTKIDGRIICNGSADQLVPKPHLKSLFLKTKNNQFYLVSLTEEKRVDLNRLSDVIGCGRFSFVKPQELLELLKLTPGAVTPYGLIFDEQNNVKFILDKDIIKSEFVGFHPLRNDMTIVVGPKDFLKVMKELRHEPEIITIPVK